MKDLYFIVEGETELEFINKIVIPYLYKNGAQCNVQAFMITMSGGGHGFNNIQHFINTITPVLHYVNQPIITTLVDYFRLNSETKLPGYSGISDLNSVDDKVSYLESKLNDVVQSIGPYQYFIPYIQKHEMESLFFADPEAGFSLEIDAIRQAVLQVCQQYNNVEDINGTEFGAPSKRLETFYRENGKRYVKVIDGIDIAELTGIDKILEKCPRFRVWMEKIIFALNNY